MADLLDDAEIASALEGLPAWERHGETIERFAKIPGFEAAIAVVDEVAVLAQEQDHHPDIDIRFNSLKFKLSTHSEGGLTAKDTDLAGRIDAVVERHSS